MITIFVVTESAPYERGCTRELYTNIISAFTLEADAKAEVERLDKEGNKHKYGEPFYTYEEVELS